jgi:lipid II:glycine glycyltransferase (peptidoglycan interpeptide bridge formation enzyme)
VLTVPGGRAEQVRTSRRGREAGCGLTIQWCTGTSTADLAAWDALVRATPGTDVTQLPVWARVRAFEGFSAEYLLAWRDGVLVGGAQVLLRRLPGLGWLGYVSYGPLVVDCDPARGEIVSALAEGLTSLPGVRMLFVQPPEHGGDVRAALLDHGCRPSAAGIAPTGSVRLDLRRGEDEIRRGLPPRTRSWIRRWPREGVTVRIGDADDVPVLAELMRVSAEAKGFRPPHVDYLRHLYAELSCTGNAALFIGEVGGAPVAADLVTVCGSVVRGRLGGFDRSGEGGRLSVPHAVRWEIIRWAQRQGHEWLDFGGLSEQTLRDAVDRGVTSCGSWPGADQAKMRYGGVPFRYPGAVELIRPGALRLAYDLTTASEPGRRALHRAKVWLRGGRGGRHVSAPVTRAAPCGRDGS